MNTLKPLLDFYISHGGKAAWIQRIQARDKAGYPCNVKDGAKWCLSGAVNYLNIERGHPVWCELRRRLDYCTVVVWNDEPGRTWEQVEELLRKEDFTGDIE